MLPLFFLNILSHISQKPEVKWKYLEKLNFLQCHFEFKNISVIKMYNKTTNTWVFIVRNHVKLYSLYKITVIRERITYKLKVK